MANKAKTIKPELLNFIKESSSSIESFQFMGYSEHLYKDFKKKNAELTPNFIVPLTTVLLVCDDNRNLCKYGKKYFSYCNGEALTDLCTEYKISRFSPITLKVYKKLVIELSNNFFVGDNILNVDWNYYIENKLYK
jgi:hypothetical protein